MVDYHDKSNSLLEQTVALFTYCEVKHHFSKPINGLYVKTTYIFLCVKLEMGIAQELLLGNSSYERIGAN